MKTFKVIWEERRSITIEAKSKKEAIDKVYSNKYDEGQESAEISSPPEAFEMD